MVPELLMHSARATSPGAGADVTRAHISQRTAKAPRLVGVDVYTLNVSDRRRSGED